MERLLSLLFLMLGPVLHSAEAEQHVAPSRHHFRVTHAADPGLCAPREEWSYLMGHCRPLPGPDAPDLMATIHLKGFVDRNVAEGPRARTDYSSNNMLMLGLGGGLGERQFLQLDATLNAEQGSFPIEGRPQLLQQGGVNRHGRAYVDAAAPHPSPFSELMFSDKIRLGPRSYFQFRVGPRGDGGYGPLSYQHRPSASENPDAPLGHGMGQDSGHVTDSIVGAGLKLRGTWLEATAFHGREPDPARTTLNVEVLDSGSARMIQQLKAGNVAVISGAYVRHPTALNPESDYQVLGGFSLHCAMELSEHWDLHHSWIAGIKALEEHRPLLSGLFEFVVHGAQPHFWGRLEVVERRPADLNITGLPDADRGRAVGAATLGYTHHLLHFPVASLGLGVSATKNFLPQEYQRAYDGEPWSAKAFLQLEALAASETRWD